MTTVDFNTHALRDKNIWREAQKTMGSKFTTMISYYMEDTSKYLQEIAAGMAAQDYAQIIAPAHSLKSSSRQLGFLRISEIAKTLEHGGREGTDWAMLKQYFPLARQAFAEMQELVAQAV